MKDSEIAFADALDSLDFRDKELLKTIMMGILSGRIQLSLEEAKSLKLWDWEALARRLSQFN